jgi:hypothetical protein
MGPRYEHHRTRHVLNVRPNNTLPEPDLESAMERVIEYVRTKAVLRRQERHMCIDGLVLNPAQNVLLLLANQVFRHRAPRHLSFLHAAGAARHRRYFMRPPFWLVALQSRAPRLLDTQRFCKIDATLNPFS